MSEERVARNTHTMVQRLEDLRIEHMSLINSLDSPKTEKSDIILKNIKSIDIGLDEAQLMMEFTSHLQNVEIEKQKFIAQLKQFAQENDNLRRELLEAQEKLKNFEKTIAEYATVKECMELAICPDTGFDQINASSANVTFIELCDTVSDHLRDDDSDSTLTPRQSDNTVNVDSDESEALSQFRSLQNQVIHYASEGKYEIAHPLCIQAIDNLEKTTIGRFHPYVTKMMSIVSAVYGVQNKYNEATILLHDAIRVKTQPLHTFG